MQKPTEAKLNISYGGYGKNFNISFEHKTAMGLMGIAYWLRDIATKLEDEYNGVK